MLLRQLPFLVVLLLSVPAGCADEIDLDTRTCGYQSPGPCAANGCVRFCTEADGCLCLNAKRAVCDESCASGCTPMANMPTNDAQEPWRHACTQALKEARAERDLYAPQ